MYDFFNQPAVTAANTATATTTTTAPKPNFWDTLFKAADATANVITAVKQPVQPSQPLYYQQQPPPPQPNNNMKTVLIVGGVAVAGIVAWSLLGNKKK